MYMETGYSLPSLLDPPRLLCVCVGGGLGCERQRQGDPPHLAWSHRYKKALTDYWGPSSALGFHA